MFFEVPGGHKISFVLFQEYPRLIWSCLSHVWALIVTSQIYEWDQCRQLLTREWYFTNLLEKKHLIRFLTYYTTHASRKKYLLINCTKWQSYWKFNSKTPCNSQEPSKTHVVQDSCIHDCQDTSLPDTCLWLPLLVPAMQKTSKQCAHFEASNLKRSSKKTTLLVDFLHIRWNRRTGPFLPMSFFPTKIREVANGTHLSDLRSFPALRTRNLDNFR